MPAIYQKIHTVYPHTKRY